MPETERLATGDRAGARWPLRVLPSGLQQRDLARLAGVRHESFCRSLGKFERAGLVKRAPEGLRIERHDDLVELAG